LPFCHIQLTARKPPSPAYPRELKTLGDHLRKRRLDLGLLQRDVAEKLQVNQMTVCNWETNRTSPQLRFIPSIVAFLGYSPDYTQSDSLGKRILARRRLLGLSQKELAHHLGIDQSTLRRWERDRSRPSKKLLRRLDAFLTSHLSGVVEPEQ
jgi:transcriptional regulator with XRE-family HTH domain